MEMYSLRADTGYPGRGGGGVSLTNSYQFHQNGQFDSGEASIWEEQHMKDITQGYGNIGVGARVSAGKRIVRMIQAARWI